MGSTVGSTVVGVGVGTGTGDRVGMPGATVGMDVGLAVGMRVGQDEGGTVGVAVGTWVDTKVGALVGGKETVGDAVGCAKTSPPVAQKWSSYGACRSWKCPPISSTNSNPISLSCAPPPTFNSKQPFRKHSQTKPCAPFSSVPLATVDGWLVVNADELTIV